MAFRMIDPVMTYKKKRRPESSKEVLRRIESYLNGNFEEPIRILHNMWEHQSDTIGYQELRQIVIDGTIGYEILRTWAEDYSKLVDAHIKSLWKDAMQAGRYGQPVLDQIDFGINFQSQRVQQWIGERGAQLVTNCIDTQIESIKTLMTEKMRQMYTPDHIARMIRPCIGLTAQQTSAVKNYYNTMVGTLQESHSKMKLENVYRKAEEESMKYAERLHRLRAQTIVQTESAFAYNKGADEAIRQAQEQNLIGDCVKRWCTSGDARVCQMCVELDGTEIAMDDDFKIKGKAKFEGMHMLPPAHPRCACAVEYIESEQNNRGKNNTGRTKEQTDYLVSDYAPDIDTTEEREIIEDAVSAVPKKVREKLNEGTIINVGKSGACQYDYTNDILYVAKGADKTAVIHEIGHMVENKMLDASKVMDVLICSVGEVDIMNIKNEIYYDSENNPVEIIFIKRPSFISDYQGRIYADTIWDAYDYDGNFRYEYLMEYISEGFREYVENPGNLLSKNKELFLLLEEALK